MQYFIITYGCQMNKSDSERIAVTLGNFGYKPAKNAEQAGLIVVNACSVRQSAMDRVYAKINKYYKDKSIILAGCVLESDKKKLQDKVDDIWHPDYYFDPPAGGEKQGSAKHGSYFECSHPGSRERSRETFSGNSPRTFLGKSNAFIPIMTGCNNFCSYCVVPYTRGREKSRPADKILEEVKALVKKGYKEIMLLGQNVNSYISPSLRGVRMASKQSRSSTTRLPRSLCSLAMTESINFPRLLRLLNSIPGNFTIKFLTSHPKDISDELINTITDCEKVSKEIHLPVQSGDNTILKKMNRKYRIAHYKKLIKKIRQKIPNAIISTDVIVGFPGETKKQFANTVKLFKKIKFNKAYIAMYSPRPDTAAYKLKDNVPKEEKKKRWKILDEIVNKKPFNCDKRMAR